MRPLQSVGSRLTVAAMTIVLGTPGLATADGAADGKDATYYISLGDSLASGYQPDVDKDTDVAYTDQLYTQLKQRTPGLKHIRLGCTAETTESLLKGGTVLPKRQVPAGRRTEGHGPTQRQGRLRDLASARTTSCSVRQPTGAFDRRA